MNDHDGKPFNDIKYNCSYHEQNVKLEVENARLKKEIEKPIHQLIKKNVALEQKCDILKADVARLTRAFGDFKAVFTNWGESERKNDELKRIVVDALK